MVVTHRLQGRLDTFTDHCQARHRLTNLSILPVNLKETLNACRDHICSLALLEWMPAKHLLTYNGRRLVSLLQQVDQCMAISSVQSECIFISRHRHLLHVLTQLNPGVSVDLDQLVDAAQCRLPLTRDQVSSCEKVRLSDRHYHDSDLILTNSEAINLMSLLVKTDNGVLVDVIRSDDGQLIKPRDVKASSDTLKGLPGQTGQVREITRINADSHRTVSHVV